jgi:hypothetical protein
VIDPAATRDGSEAAKAYVHVLGTQGCAVRIQAAYRGYRERKRTKLQIEAIKRRRRKECGAATSIQRAARGHLARRHFAQMREQRSQEMLHRKEAVDRLLRERKIKLFGVRYPRCTLSCAGRAT